MTASPRLTDTDFERLADFRYALRRFLFFSEEAAAKEGLTPQQHQALLVVRGNTAGYTSIGTLARRLCLKHHTVVELVQRLENAGFITKQTSPEDRRSVILDLTDEGQNRLDRLGLNHREELRHIGPEIIKRFSKLSAS